MQLSICKINNNTFRHQSGIQASKLSLFLPFLTHKGKKDSPNKPLENYSIWALTTKRVVILCMNCAPDYQAAITREKQKCFV